MFRQPLYPLSCGGGGKKKKKGSHSALCPVSLVKTLYACVRWGVRVSFHAVLEGAIGARRGLSTLIHQQLFIRKREKRALLSIFRWTLLGLLSSSPTPPHPPLIRRCRCSWKSLTAWAAGPPLHRGEGRVSLIIDADNNRAEGTKEREDGREVVGGERSVFPLNDYPCTIPDTSAALPRLTAGRTSSSTSPHSTTFQSKSQRSPKETFLMTLCTF